MTTVMPIVCKGIRKKFGQGDLAVPILKGIDLEVNFGELLILSGPSGSGKTTLLSIIANILKQDEWEIFLLGKNLMLLSNDERVLFRSQHLGFIFQSFNLFPYLTALENIAIPLILTGFTKKNALEIASVSLAKIGLSAKGSVCVSLLSGGEQQRVAIARAIVSNPKIVICDEPTSALDQVSGLHVMGVLREISREQEKTVIVVTHDCRTYPFADRIAKINDGRITEIVSSQDEV